MKEYIDKSALVAEIKKLEDEAKKLPSDFGCGRLSICKELMNFLDSLEVKEADLKKAEQYIKDYTRNCSNELNNGEYESWLTPDQALRAAEIAKEGTIEKACEWLRICNYAFPYKMIEDFRKAMEE